MRRMMMVMGVVAAMATGAWADETERAANGVPAKARLEVDGTLELAGEIAAGMDEGDETVVSATNLVLVGDVTVGVVAEGGKGRAILTFSSIVASDYQITLTSNGVVRSIGPEPVDVSAVFAPTDEGTVVITCPISAESEEEDEPATEEDEGPDPEKDPGAEPAVVGYEYYLVNGKKVPYVDQYLVAREVDCEQITGNTTELLGNRWYYVEGDVTLNQGLRIVRGGGRWSPCIILCDGCNLTVNARKNETAIAVRRGSTSNDQIFIYGQAGQTGHLVARGGAADQQAYRPEGVVGDGAGIGGQVTEGPRGNYNCCGNIYIYGGNVEAYGAYGAAGIGGAHVQTRKGYGWGLAWIGFGGAAKVKAVGGTGAAGIGGCYRDSDVMPKDAGLGVYEKNKWVTITKAAMVEAIGGAGAPAVGHGKGYKYDDAETKVFMYTHYAAVKQGESEASSSEKQPSGTQGNWWYQCAKPTRDVTEYLCLIAADNEPVRYRDNKAGVDKVLINYKELDSNVKIMEKGAWYCVKKDTTIRHGLSIQYVAGTSANILICDGCELKVDASGINDTPGIMVLRGTTNDNLYLYGGPQGTGKLIVYGGPNCPGIGGKYGGHSGLVSLSDCGNVYIDGITVEAYGGKNAAGIGSSSHSDTKANFWGVLRVYGKTAKVIAQGGEGGCAFIGAGGKTEIKDTFYVHAPSCTVKAKKTLSSSAEQVIMAKDKTDSIWSAACTDDQYVEVTAGGTLPEVHYTVWNNSGVPSTKPAPDYTLLVAPPKTPLVHEGWYYVADNLTMQRGITLVNDAHIIIAGNKKLEVMGRENEAGIQVRQGSGSNDNLYLYSQVGGIGKVIARGGRNGAGIGGQPNADGATGPWWINCGNVYIHGVEVEAYGGENAAGIGSSSYSDAAKEQGGDTWGTLAIYGEAAKVVAQGGNRGCAFIGASGKTTSGHKEFYVYAPSCTVKAKKTVSSSVEQIMMAKRGPVWSAACTDDQYVEVVPGGTLPEVHYTVWNNSGEPSTEKVSDYTLLVAAPKNRLANKGWYYVTDNLTMQKGITLVNDAHIIIAGGKTLTVNGRENEAGIEVRRGSGSNDNLWLYSQVGGVGKVIARGGRNGAGIGGQPNAGGATGPWWIDCGNVYVHGVEVDAYGGENAPGIGGSYREQSPGNRWGVLALYGDMTRVEATAGAGAKAMIFAKNAKEPFWETNDTYEVYSTSYKTLAGDSKGTTELYAGGTARGISETPPVASYVRIECGGTLPPVTYYTWEDPLQAKAHETTDYMFLCKSTRELKRDRLYVASDNVTTKGLYLEKFVFKATASILVKDGVTLTVEADDNEPGIMVRRGLTNNDNLYLYGGPEGTGRVVVRGGSCGAGIGGEVSDECDVGDLLKICPYVNCGNVFIHNITVDAYGGDNASGIGGSFYRNMDDVKSSRFGSRWGTLELFGPKVDVSATAGEGDCLLEEFLPPLALIKATGGWSFFSDYDKFYLYATNHFVEAGRSSTNACGRLTMEWNDKKKCYDSVIPETKYVRIRVVGPEEPEPGPVLIWPGHSSAPYPSREAAEQAVKDGMVVFLPTEPVLSRLGEGSLLSVQGYLDLFSPVIYQSGEQQWRVMYEINEKGTNLLAQSVRAVVTNLDVRAIAALPAGGDTNLVTRGGVPGFYYTLFKSAAVTDVLTAAAHDKANSDRLCDGTGSVVFQKVAKPSAAAGFFTTGVSSEPTFPSGDETPADIRGGGIIVIPPVTTTGSDD